jgi:hypothetical protein
MKAKLVSENIRFERGKDPKTAMNLGVVKEIMDNTEEAYSRDRYGDQLWEEIIVWLLEGGYSSKEIELILGSKYMRWGMDQMADEGSLEEFDNYFSDNEDGIQEMIYDELGPQDLEENVVAGGTGGVSAPMATLANTPGVGNVVPGAGEGGIGSGDRFDNQVAEKKKKKKKKRKRAKAVNEMNINPHDPVGVAMAKKLGAALPFEKGKGDQDVRQKRIDKDIDLDTDEDGVMTIEEWQKKFLGI